MKIAFIGLGIMGSRMAANLQNTGHTDLTVYNRTADKAAALVSSGATLADSPAAAVEGADVVFTVLAHPPAVEETALGEGGFLDAMQDGALWVDCSTVNPSFTRRMATEAEKRGVHFMDAPIAGSKEAAANAQVTLLVGGSESDLETARPLLDAMSSRVVHVGDVGMGISFKVVLNYLLAASLASFSEAATLAQALGLPKAMVFEALTNTPVVPAYMAGKRAMMEAEDYETHFPLRWLVKDLQMALTAAYENGVSMPVAGVTKEVFQLAVRDGFGDEDISAIYSFIKQSADEE